MAIPKKSGPAASILITGQIPQPPPKIPEEMRKKFPVWDIYQTQVEEWWSRFSDMFQRDRSQIQAQFQSDEASSKTSLESLQAALDALSAKVANLPSSSFAAQFAALSAALAAHIAATKAHGTISSVVGVTDTQDLENKTIGASAPGYGRFIAGALGYRVIDPNITITVGASDFLVTAGPVDVFGSLVVDGTLVAM